MKIRTLYVAALAALTLASCNREGNENGGPEADATAAYLSLQINMPAASPETYVESGPTNKAATAAETTVNNIRVIGFDAAYAITDKLSFTLAELGSTSVGVNPSLASTAFKVSSQMKYALIIINPSAKMVTQIASAVTYAQLNAVVSTEAESALRVAATGFMMVSAGVAVGDKGLVDVSGSIKKSTNNTTAAINTAKSNAQGAAVAISVDRVLTKATMTAFTPVYTAGSENVLPVGAKATIDGWKLNATNKTYLPYSEIVSYTGFTMPTKGIYRQDNNYTAVAKTAAATLAAFNWWHNPGSAVTPANPLTAWNTPGTADEYALENTMEAAAQDYNNTTKIVIKGTYTPSGVTAGDSWFRVGGTIKTLAQLQADYSAEPAGTDYKNSLVAFLNCVLGGSRTIGWSGEGKATTVGISHLDAVANGDYLAACTGTFKYMVEYFQKSVCYYDCPIKHDNRMTENTLGRWGMVRNNWYTFTVTKINQPGKPYIPDPTDPAIKDPENPDPTKPDPDDPTTTFLSLKITVNPWASWVQEAEL